MTRFYLSKNYTNTSSAGNKAKTDIEKILSEQGYKYAGLPPGPICMPSIKAIDAVLNYQKHKYVYFAAKPDFSGYHNFAVTLAEHNRNADAYRRALNAAGIR